MQANHLKAYELSYEIKIRDETVPDTVEEKRRLLNGLLAREKANRSFSSPINTYSFEEDHLEILNTIQDLGEIINNFNGNKREPVFSRINSRLTHLTNRINRLNIDPDDDQQVQTKNSLNRDVLLLESDFDMKTTPFISVDSEETHDNHVPLASSSLSSPSVPQSRHDPVYKWNISFSGKNESLHLFLEKVELLRVSRGISDTELFLQSCEFFRGSAFTWFLNNRSKFSTWSDIVAKLKADFLPYSYETDLELEILNRTMGENEPVTVYISSMIGLFNRLTNVVDEKSRVAKIRRNLLPFFVSALALHSPNTVDELTELCKRVEESRVWSDRYRPPSSQNCLLEPDLACLYVSSNTSSKRKSSVDVSVISSSLCWNCSRTGHIFTKCRSPKSIFCYGCGAKNTTKPNCSSCNPKNEVQTGPVNLTTVSSPTKTTSEVKSGSSKRKPSKPSTSQN